MPEWLNGPASKTGDSNRFEGSNPSLSFIKKVDPTGVCFFLYKQHKWDENPLFHYLHL